MNQPRAQHHVCLTQGQHGQLPGVHLGLTWKKEKLQVKLGTSHPHDSWGTPGLPGGCGPATGEGSSRQPCQPGQKLLRGHVGPHEALPSTHIPPSFEVPQPLCPLVLLHSTYAA